MYKIFSFGTVGSACSDTPQGGRGNVSHYGAGGDVSILARFCSPHLSGVASPSASSNT